MKQKVTRFALTLLVMMLTTATAWAQTTIMPTTPSQDGDGYYLIGTAAELYGFAELVNNGNKTANAKLTADIVVNENVLDADGEAITGDFVQWTLIGNVFYSGTFDGQGHTISGLYVSGSSGRVGLIGRVSGSATIKNLGIVDSYFSSSGDRLGSIVGDVDRQSSVTLANVYSTSTVKGVNWIGGLVGDDGNGSVTIINSYFAGKTSAGWSYDDHHDDLVSGAFVGPDSGTLNIVNTFVVGTSLYGTMVTAEQMSNGTVAAALHYYQDALADGSMFGMSGGKTNFSGTIDGVSVPTANITLHTFTGDTKTYSSKYVVGNTTTLPVNVACEGYNKFAGWYNNANLVGNAITSISSSETGDKEYWAKYKQSHTVTFELNGGHIGGGEIDHYIEGEVTPLPAVVRKGDASFEGWYTTPDCSGERYVAIPATATEDMTFYAKWGEAKTTFYLVQGGSPEPVNVLYEGENIVWLDETTLQSYKIFNNEFKFWGSGNTITVPYDGGEYAFSNSGNNFSVHQSGFYVFTLTDYGGENWFVSVLKLKSMLNCDVASIPTQVYTGSAIEPDVTVKDGETPLYPEDYEVTYSNNVNVGTATVTITGKGNYSGETAATFTIIPKAVTNDGITIAAIADQTYTGSAIEPAVTVTDGEKTLTLGTDYTIGYSANVNVGTATATITGKGNYTGSKDATFTIAPKSMTNEGITVTIPSQTWTGNELTPVITVKDGQTVLTENTDYTVTAPSGPVQDSGNHAYTITGMGNYSDSKEAMFTISPKLVTNDDITVTIPSQTWTGSVLTPVITVKDGQTVLTENTDYTVTAPSGPVQDSGNHAYTITGMGNYSDSREATFTITPFLADQFGAVYVYEDQNGMTALLDGTSVDPVDIDFNHNIIVNHVTSNRVFTPGMASTVMLPFNYTCNGNEGGTFYKFVGVKKENDKWVATMQETGNDTNKQGTLEANTPYLFMPAASTMTFPNINGSVRLFTRDGGSGGNCETADPGSHWTFKGTYWFKEWNSSNYYDAEEIGRAYGFAGVAKDGINVGDFVRGDSGAKIRPMRAYLLWNEYPNSASARRMTRSASNEVELPQSITVRLVGSNGETTGIGEIDTKTGEMTFDSEAWYTLDGVRLSGKPTKKGLYINNGKKIVIK